jgi:hypothetical protein
MKFINTDIINEWMSNGMAVLEHSASGAIYNKISSLPWVASHLDYSKIPGKIGFLSEMESKDGDIDIVKIKSWMSNNAFLDGG